MSGLNILIPTDVRPDQARPDPAALLFMQLAGTTMGTTWSAQWLARPGLDPETVRQAFEDLFDELTASMSPWETGSLISRFNRLPTGGEIEIDASFDSVLSAALGLARQTDGAFDPCLGGAVMRRGFGATGIGAGADGRLSGPVAWDGLDTRNRYLRQPGGVTLDLCAIAKGYGVDRMAAILQSLGISQYLVEIGGEFAARGVKPDRQPWWIDLERPAAGASPWRLALLDEALATSGDYRQFHIEEGVRTSHIVPHAGRSDAHGDLACVSVIADACASADGWATALFASGDRRGLELAEEFGVKALFQYRDAPARLSSALQARADQDD